MEHNREDLKKLSLVELKILCKQYGLHRTGTKTQLIKKILDLTKPEPIVVNSYSHYKLPPDKKIIGLKIDESEKRVQLGKIREKGKVKDLCYSMGVHYYIVDKDFQFI